MADSLISPHGFDGRGPVPEMVTAAAKRIAQLDSRFLRDIDLTDGDIEDLFAAAALQAEWMRELYEALHPDGDAFTEVAGQSGAVEPPVKPTPYVPGPNDHGMLPGPGGRFK